MVSGKGMLVEGFSGDSARIQFDCEVIATKKSYHSSLSALGTFSTAKYVIVNNRQHIVIDPTTEHYGRIHRTSLGNAIPV